MSTSEAIVGLGSEDGATARGALESLFATGESAIPDLMKLRGDRRPFHGGALGDPRTAQLTFEPSAEVAVGADRIVSVEVVALFLVSAIYRERLDFAQSAYLVDLREPEHLRRAANSAERVLRAWSAAERWLEEWQQRGLPELRRIHREPFAGSDISFW